MPQFKEPSHLEQTQFTALLERSRAGDSSAGKELLPHVYDHLQRIARRMMSQERDRHTLQATALVHEAYLRLSGSSLSGCEGRSHYLGIAARLMRQILVDHARARNSEKRGGGATLLSLNEDLVAEEEWFETMALHECLNQLAERDERQAKLVELRYFGGMSLEECAEVLGCSVATLKREWTMARAWLLKEIEGKR